MPNLATHEWAALTVAILLAIIGIAAMMGRKKIGWYIAEYDEVGVQAITQTATYFGPNYPPSSKVRAGYIAIHWNGHKWELDPGFEIADEIPPHG